MPNSLLNTIEKACKKLSSAFRLFKVVANFFHSSGFVQNDKELSKEGDSEHHALVKDADKNIKLILGRSSRGHGCMKSMVFVTVALAVGAAIMSQTLQS